MKLLRTVFALIAAVVIAGLAFIYSGVYPMSADAPHSKPVYWGLETLRERSIARRARNIEVPPLEEPEMLLAGGADYNEMCSGCHMKPGQQQSEISAGLYPHPPNLAIGDEAHGLGHEGGTGWHGNARDSAARQFWIIKHGIKASGMAAFGPTHDDARIWAMVAFLQKLPTLDATQYQILTARAEGDMAAIDGMDHGHDNIPAAAAQEVTEAPGNDAHAGMDMSGMEMKPATEAAASSPPAAVDAFNAALKSGDAAAAQGWLAPDVLIYEGGGAERSRAEYVGHHLAGDIAFMTKARVEILHRSSGGDDEAAWVTTESRMRGKSSKGKPLDVASTETALLRKTSEGWRIVHLHWSSQDYKITP